VSPLIRRTVFASAGIALGAAALTGCGSSSDGSTAGTSSSGGATSSAATTESAACSLTSPPTSAASLPASTGTSLKATGKVGVILPDTTSSTRYTLYDKPLLTAALSAAGLTPDVENAQGSKTQFASIAQNMINEGVKVLIIDSIDPASGAAVEKQADTAGIPVIDYDRVNLGGTAPYYVSFDNEDVGKLQASTLLACLSAEGISNPKIIMMDGGTDVDNNAVLFAKGAKEVFSAAGITPVSEETVLGWDVTKAAPAFTQALTAAGNDVDGVLAANDDIANAVIGVLKSQGLNGQVAVTGQDSGVEGLQNIIEGQQSMTVFKNVKLEANAAAQLAIALASGTDPSKAGLTLTKFDDPTSPSHDIQALLLPAQVITQANVGDVIKAGALTASEICKGIQSDCTTLGIS
jgi:D-xylose transport system substrate-binding protein